MSGQRPPTFGDLDDPFGQVSNVNDYEPPSVNTATWTTVRPQDEEEGVGDDEPFTVADLSTAPGGTVPSALPGRSVGAASQQAPFKESVKPPREVSGRIGPAQSPPPPRPPPVPTSDSASLLGGAGQTNSSAALPGVEDPQSFPFYNIKRYRTYFNVDTSDVLHRIVRALAFFFKGDFVDHTDGNPDLYGPFWIASTLVFVSAAAGNYASYIAYNRSHSEEEHASAGWYYDIDKVGGSMGLFYGYVGIAGLAVWGILRWFKAAVKLAHVWCIYGYAMVVFLPMAILCVIPAEALRWAVVGAATFSSGMFLLLNFRGPLVEAAGVTSGPIMLVMLGAHALMGLGLKLYFFHYT